ncbi:MAG: SDR family NAD(P)-dependent oxidoreductase [Reinekea sp.]|jgi:NAD(P)-dependent dehydrogenase (short-subunit alcohol dehydrogenase family)
MATMPVSESENNPEPNPMPTTAYSQLISTFPSMHGKSVLITGCTSGTGLTLARTCGKLGAKVIMLNRMSPRAEAALALLREEDRSDAVLIRCDLQEFSSIRQAGAELRERYRESGCDVLCNNAGIMGFPDTATVDGYDIQIQTNYLGHFLLTHEVWSLLKRGAELRGEARVVNHSSGARNAPYKPIMAKYFERHGGKLGEGWLGMQKWQRYQQSKLANLLFSYALHDRRPQGSGQKIKVVTAHPGPTRTELQVKTHNAGATSLLDRLIVGRITKRAHSVDDGTSGIARCCCEPGINSGDFYGPVGRGQPGPAVLLPPERAPIAEQLLWDLSLNAISVRQFFPDT